MRSRPTKLGGKTSFINIRIKSSFNTLTTRVKNRMRERPVEKYSLTSRSTALWHM
ncbi:MAG: hypothetical protein NPIRA02_17790 [Nitrospirales bacterium]|nr:MAG: hypothetical protein NPIRA02_17790 [Nitrospirales bacterium]